MEIYKLEDNVLGIKKRSNSVASFYDDGKKELKVTDIRQGIRSPNRVNVFIDDKYAFSLDVAQVVDFGIKIGIVITDEQLQEYKRASEFGKAYQRALEWVLMRPRSERELKDYLKNREYKLDAKERKKEWDVDREIADLIAKGEDAQKIQARRKRRTERPKYDFANEIVERLMARGYVDDEKFAKYYVENRFVKKGISQKRLRMELVKKGVSTEIIEKVLCERNDEEEILKIIVKKRAKYDDEKLTQYLCRQGFDYQLAQSLVRDYGMD